MEAQVLENRIISLETLLAQAKQDSTQMSKELSLAKIALEKINLPKITKETVDEIREAITQTISNYDFDRSDSYSYELEIDYDNRIQLSNIEFDAADDLAESISDSVEYLFNIIDDEE
jgi:septation ring formation regulator EzrA